MDILYELRGRPQYCKCGATLQSAKVNIMYDRKTGEPRIQRIILACPVGGYGSWEDHERYVWTQRVKNDK